MVNGIAIWTGYVFDAEGRRVAKGTLTPPSGQNPSCNPATNGLSASLNEIDYILDQEGHQVTEMASDPNGANGSMYWTHTNVWADGQLIATYSAIDDATCQSNGLNCQPNCQQIGQTCKDGALHFYLNDWLGTRRVQTDYAGVVEQTCSSLPFGDGLNCTQSTQFPTEHHFTGKERDAESGNDYFGARYYASTMGRFLSPDYNETGDDLEPVPYADWDDPQSLNLYSYGRNNPSTRRDYDGHFQCNCPIDPDWWARRYNEQIAAEEWAQRTLFEMQLNLLLAGQAAYAVGRNSPLFRSSNQPPAASTPSEQSTPADPNQNKPPDT